jgi:isoleucyl-tRNA synthetase
MSETIQTRLTDAYRKLRNTFRYMLSNVFDFDPLVDAVAADEMHEIDRWILVRAEDLVTRCRAWYENFEFHKVYHAAYAFATVDLSNIYFDVLKDRLYTSAKKSKARRSAQTAVYRLLDALVRLLAPLMSFTAEEVWTHMNREGSVHTAYFPEPSELTEGLSDAARERTGNWDRLIEVRDQVLKSLETARNEKLIGAPLEARLKLAASGDLLSLLEEYAADLPGLFIVSQVVVTPAEEAAPLSVTVERASGQKCERCWKYTHDVGADSRYPTVCACCADAVEEQSNELLNA